MKTIISIHPDAWDTIATPVLRKTSRILSGIHSAHSKLRRFPEFKVPTSIHRYNRVTLVVQEHVSDDIEIIVFQFNTVHKSNIQPSLVLMLSK